MNTANNRAEDCKSSIVSSILTRASNLSRRDNEYFSSKKSLQSFSHEVILSDFVSVPVTITVDGSDKVSLSFQYKGHKHKRLLNCPLSELHGSDIDALVKKFVKKIDNVRSIEDVLNFVLENDECGGNYSTRKKNDSHFRDLCNRDGIDLSQSTKSLLKCDDFGKTILEQWASKYGLPHKIRQIRSIFSRKNLIILKRNGFDVSHFDNFVTYIAETTTSTPFTTDDAEIDRIIKFFDKARIDHPVFYDIYLLAFGCGLRASEIYQVKYQNFTKLNSQHFLLLPFATKRTKLKGVNYVEKVGISKQVYDHFTSREKSGDVINGGLRLHRRFVKFLKQEVGIEENKACHRLRKILGARLATTAGIFHASKTLRNSVAVCEKYYSDLTAHANELEV